VALDGVGFWRQEGTQMNGRTRTLLVSLRHARRAYAFEHGREPTHVALNPVDVLELETAPALSAFAHGSVGRRFVAGMRLVEDLEVPTGTYELWHDPDKAFFE
jgi:hypothetical protein